MLGIIMVARGPPGEQSGGGQLSQRSPRLNKPQVILSQVLQPARLAVTRARVVSRMRFFMVNSSANERFGCGHATVAQGW